MALDLGSYFSSLQQPGPNAQPVQNPYPPGYLSPTAIKANYDYAQALLKNSEGTVPGTKGGWTVGVQHLVDALMGGHGLATANQGELGTAATNAGNYWKGQPQPPGSTPGQNNPAPGSDAAPSTQESATPQGGAVQVASLEGSPVLDALEKATIQQESNGNSKNVTTTVNQKTGQPQYALGLYGIMDSHLGPNGDGWDKEALGKTLTPQEFLNDPQAQKAIYDKKMGQYVQQYGIEGAGRAWLGGPGGVNNPQRTDPLGTQVGNYGQKFTQLVANAGARGGPPGAVPMQQVPGGLGPNYTPAQLPPGVVPPASTYDRDTMVKILGAPGLDPALKLDALSQYRNTQVNPRVVPGMGGQYVVPAGSNGGAYFVPSMQTGTKKIGPIEHPTNWYYDPARGGNVAPPTLQPGNSAPAAPVPGPQGNAAPLPPPVAPNGGAAPPGPVPVTPGRALASAAPPPQQNAPAAPVGPPMAQPNTGEPVKVASLGNIPVPPEVAAGAEAKIPTMPNAVAQASGIKPTAAAAPPEGGPPPFNPVGGEVANAPGSFPPAPPGVDSEDWQQLIATQKGAASQSALEANLKSSAEGYAKQYTNYIQGGTQAGYELPQLQMAKQLVTDPNNVQGLLTQPALFYKKLTDALGISTGSAAPNLVFQKVIAGSILNGLRQFTQGASVGQIRTAEIELQKVASASVSNTPEANMALLNLAVRLQQQAVNVAQGAASYKAQHGSLDAGFDKALLDYQKQNPVLQPGDYKLISDLGDKADAAAPKGGQQPQTATPPTITDKSTYDTLPSGTRFIGSDGKPYKKP